MPTIEIAGADLYYEDLGGDRPLCVMLHGGLGMDHTYFRPTFDRLSEHVRLAYYDMRGNGRSTSGPPELLTLERWADDAALLADHLGAERFAVIGHSYGGFVAQEVALRHPDRVRAMALLCTTPGGIGSTEPPDSEQGDPPSSDQLEIMGSPVTSDDEMATMMRRLLPYYLHHLGPEVLLERFVNTIYRHDTMIRSSEVLASWSSYDRLPMVACPTLVVGGRHDNFCSAAQSERIAHQISDAKLEVFEHSGHFPWLEEPNEFWVMLEGWVAGVVS